MCALNACLYLGKPCGQYPGMWQPTAMNMNNKYCPNNSQLLLFSVYQACIFEHCCKNRKAPSTEVPLLLCPPAVLGAVLPSGARRRTFKEVDTLLKITWFLSEFKLKAVQSLYLFLLRERDHGILFFYQQCRLDDKKWKEGNKNHPRLYHMAAQLSVFLSSLCFCIFWLNFVCTQPLLGHQWRLLQTHWRTLGLKTCQSEPGPFTTWYMGQHLHLTSSSHVQLREAILVAMARFHVPLN